MDPGSQEVSVLRCLKAVRRWDASRVGGCRPVTFALVILSAVHTGKNRGPVSAELVIRQALPKIFFSSA